MSFGEWVIDIECFNKILEILPKNKTILEFGSGFGSSELSKYYKVFSIEHDEKWLNKYPNINYIYAPLKPIKENQNINWYDIDIVKDNIPEKYDLILVDGPPEATSKNRMGRMGFFYNLELFTLENVVIIFDDVERKKDLDNMISISKKIDRKYEIFEGKSKLKKKKFGVIF